jgi:hypothetical protein
VAAAGLAAAPSAEAGVVTYTSADVPKNIFHSGNVPSTLTVPPGRTAIQSIDVTNYGYNWPASGQELSAQLFSPDGASMFLFEIGCFDSPANASFTLTDAAPSPLPEKNGCDNINLVGTSFRPVDPQGRQLSFFNGRTPSGTWTLRSIDNGVSFLNQGSLRRWSLRITHAPPTFTASGPGAANVGAPIVLTAFSNATGAVTVGGDANPATTNMTAGISTAIPFTPTAAVLNQIKKTGTAQATVNLGFADQTGGTASSSVAVTLKGKKAKKKKKKKRKKKKKKR